MGKVISGIIQPSSSCEGFQIESYYQLDIWFRVMASWKSKTNKSNNRKHIKYFSSLMLSNLYEKLENQSIFLFVMAQIFPRNNYNVRVPMQYVVFLMRSSQAVSQVNCKNDPAFQQFPVPSTAPVWVISHTTYFSDTHLSLLVLPAFKRNRVPLTDEKSVLRTTKLDLETLDREKRKHQFKIQ